MADSPPASPQPSAGGPLSPKDMEALVAARQRAKKLRRAASVAAFSGWSMAIFAAITLLSALFGDLIALAAGVALSVIAWNELRGAAMLARFDRRGPSLLGRNQLALAMLIIAYAAWSLMAALRSPMLASVGGSTGDPNMDATIARLESLILYSLYITLAAVGAVIPPLTAWYYYSRAPILRDFLAQTPAWIADTLRAAA